MLLSHSHDVVFPLSVRPGYSYFKGQRLSGDDLSALVDALHKNDLLRYNYLLTGAPAGHACAYNCLTETTAVNECRWL